MATNTLSSAPVSRQLVARSPLRKSLTAPNVLKWIVAIFWFLVTVFPIWWMFNIVFTDPGSPIAINPRLYPSSLSAGIANITTVISESQFLISDWKGTVRLLQRLANGDFDQWDTSFGSPILRLETVDLDGDGRLDLLAVVPNSAFLASLLKRAGRSFTGTSCPNGVADEAAFVAVQAADLNLDGMPDLVAATNDGRARLFLNRGGCQFEATESVGTLLDPRGIAVGDLNGDAAPDIVTIGDDGFRVLFNACRWR